MVDLFNLVAYLYSCMVVKQVRKFHFKRQTVYIGSRSEVILYENNFKKSE